MDEEPHEEEEEIREEETPIEEEPEPEPEVEAEVPEPLAPRATIPITLVVELGKVEMSAEKVLGLQPGNTIELDRAPGERVNLIAGGKKIGTGELLRVGEMLGVRILELG